ncbi:MAG: choice-of-anchor E domain-containing protein [Verrucomicrobia bacterium]|nr:choice-of-anchor E domain-containing protein [Verrucomicrobiota bacterium]
MRTNSNLLVDRAGALSRLVVMPLLSLMVLFGTRSMAQSELETICHSVRIEPARLNWVAQLEIPQFDPALGTLESVSVEVDASIVTDFQAENVNNWGDEGAYAPVTASINTTVCLQLDGTVLATAQPSIQRQENIAARYDGVFDFGGASGISAIGITASDTGTRTLTAASGDDLSAFVGNGAVPMTLSAQGYSKVKGSGNLVISISTVAGGSVKVCYSYRRTPPGGGFCVFVEGQAVCDGESGILTAQVIAQATGTQSTEFYYTWYDSNGNLVTDENGQPVNTHSIQVDQPGAYTVEVWDGNGGRATATGEFTVWPTPEPELALPSPLPQAGQQSTLAPINIDPNATYEWTINATGPGWAIVDGQNMPIVTYKAGSSCTAVFTLKVKYPSGCSKEASIRFGLQKGEGCTIGFWRNKNGMRLITEEDFADLNTLGLLSRAYDLNKLHLRNANGTNRDFSSSSLLTYNKGVLGNWFTYANSVNMAYMLSAQLAAFTLNVRHGFYTPETMIPVTINGATYLYAAADLIEEVNKLLADQNDVNGDGREDGGYVPKGHPNRALFEAYSKALDAANNNCRR